MFAGRDERRLPPLGDQYCRIDPGRRAEAASLQSACDVQGESCPPPQGARISRTGIAEPLARAPLDDQHGSLEGGVRSVQEPAKKRRRDRKGNACDYSVGSPRERQREEICFEDRDVGALEATSEPRREARIALYGDDLGASPNERSGQCACAGSQVENEVTGMDTPGLDQLSGEPGVI